MEQKKLNKILELHQNWIEDNNKGKRADLSNASLSYADLRNVDLNNADLSNVDLSNASLIYADLNNADLRHVDLIYASLIYADLSNADLSNVDLHHADLSNANLSHANLSRLITIIGSAHNLQYYNNQLKIGRYEYPLAYWLIMYDTIGQEEGYTEEQIKEYKSYIDMLKQFYKWGSKWQTI